MTTKIKTLVRAPALTASGYGVHSRQIIFSLLNDPTIDLYLEAVPWGGCAYLTDNSQDTQILKKLSQKFLMAKHNKQDNDFGLFISVTIPNEFERRGALNIGVTAASETDRCSAKWLECCNQMDVIVVPSVHAHRNLTTPILNWQNRETGEEGSLKLDRPCVVCPEGFDISLFKDIPELQTRVKDLKFSSDFNFLVVGQWGNGGFGDDRKNIANTILYFLQAFRGRKDVGLVLKVNMSRNSKFDKEQVTQRIESIKANFKQEECPPIHLLHATLSDKEMGELYNHPQIKSFLTLTHGEGFGLPILEAAASGLPIIATNWSGHLDFLKNPQDPERLFSAVEYTLTTVPEAAVWEPVIVKESKWAVPDSKDAIRRMQRMVESYETPKRWARKLQTYVHNTFSLQRTQKFFLDVVSEVRKQNGGSDLTKAENFESIIDDQNAYNVLYTMPMSTGDVFISSAVVDGVVKAVKAENHDQDVHVYFATNPQYHSILKDNPNIHKVINWQDNMMDIGAFEGVFDLVLTPNVATQFLFSNWVRAGHGRLLAEEFANHCQTELGDYFIAEDDSVFTDVVLSENGDVDLRHRNYITFHPGSGKGQWEARKYVEWKEVLTNLKASFPDVTIVQVGGSDEPLYTQADIDMRGNTSVHQLASLIKSSKLHLSIDTFTMHLAASYSVPLVALFGSSHASSTGPWYREPEKQSYILLEAQNKMGCKAACYKYQCKVNADLPCINEIDSAEVVKCATSLLKSTTDLKPEEHEYKRVFGTISAYTTSYNAITMGYPFIESIQSMLGFADEVIIVDHSTDGTYEMLEKMAQDEPRIQLYSREWEKDNPTQDGDSKAYGRALCQYEFCWQQDLDEVVHEKDYDKIKWITKRFPSSADILHLPVVECWGDDEHATGRRHSWKWRISRNLPHITHGVNADARITNPDTGKVYAKEGMSDGCEMISQIDFKPLPHIGFYNQQIEDARISNPEQFEQIMNMVIDRIPSVWHYSWRSLPLKISQFEKSWNEQWSVLYQKEMPPRFPKDADITELCKKLYDEGGEESDSIKYKYKLAHKHPAIMGDWLEEHTGKLKATG